MSNNYLAANIRLLPDTGDHVPATRDFKEIGCLASAPGAVGDCVRPKDHDGVHQGAWRWAWNRTATYSNGDTVIVHGYRAGFAYITFHSGSNEGTATKVPASWITED